MISSAALWGIWKLRNHMCFQNRLQPGLQKKKLWLSVIGILKNWAMLCAAEDGSTGGCYVMAATFNFQEQKLLELPFDLEVQMEGAPRCTSELVHDVN